MPLITVEQLRKIAPRCKNPEVWVPLFIRYFEQYKINTKQRVGCFLPQAIHESDQLNKLVENLNYSPDGLANTWKTRFALSDGKGGYAKDPKTKRYLPNGLAMSIGRTTGHAADQVKIANIAYANRMGNGPPESGDGWKRRGRGIFMTTGTENQQLLQKATGLPVMEKPEILSEPEGAVVSACFFYQSRGLNGLADLCDTDEEFNKMSSIVNGGDIGKEERLDLWKKTMIVLG